MQNRVFVEPIMAKEVHIDTVRLSHAYRAKDLPSPLILDDMGFYLNSKRRGDNKITTAYNRGLKEDSGEPHIAVIRSEKEHCYNGVNVECSLAKIVNRSGLGVQTEEDINCALDAIEDFIRQRINVEFDARTAKVQRFDVNADFPVGEERIRLYVNAVSRPNSRLIASTFGDTTNYYYNQSRTLALYGKKEEMEKQFKKGKVSQEDVLAAEGLLRLETRLKTGQAINRFAEKLSLSRLACELLTKDVAFKSIADMLSQLRLNEPRFSMEARNYLLLKHFGNKAPEMLGTLEYWELLGDDFWKEIGWSKATFHRKKSDLISANLWDISPAEALPALAIPDTYNNPTSVS